MARGGSGFSGKKLQQPISSAFWNAGLVLQIVFSRRRPGEDYYYSHMLKLYLRSLKMDAPAYLLLFAQVTPLEKIRQLVVHTIY